MTAKIKDFVLMDAFQIGLGMVYVTLFVTQKTANGTLMIVKN